MYSLERTKKKVLIPVNLKTERNIARLIIQINLAYDNVHRQTMIIKFHARKMPYNNYFKTQPSGNIISHERRLYKISV